MLKIFARFKKPKKAAKQQPPHRAPETPAAPSARTRELLQRELVAVVLRDVVRKAGLEAGAVKVNHVWPHSSQRLVAEIVMTQPQGLAHQISLQRQTLAGLRRLDGASEYVLLWNVSALVDAPQVESTPQAPAEADLDFVATQQVRPEVLAEPAPAPKTKPKFDLPVSDLDNMQPDFADTVAQAG
jgi:hypothetical protein